MTLLNSLSASILTTFFPSPCKVCSQLVEAWSDGVVCQQCWSNLPPFVLANCCQRCAYPLKMAPHYAPPNECSYCRTLTFTTARCLGQYQGVLRANILALKKYPIICKRLQSLIEEHILGAENSYQNDLIIPVPLHIARQKERGFNQAEVIAEKLSQMLSIPIDRTSLARIKSTHQHRAGMDIVDRLARVAGAFQVIRPKMLVGKKILLVDDIFTTGSTISTCAKVLFKSGVKEVNVFTLARTIL